MLPHRHFFATSSNKTERRLSDILKGGKMNLNRQCGQQVMTEDASLKASAQHDTWSVYLRETRLTEEREKLLSWSVELVDHEQVIKEIKKEKKN